MKDATGELSMTAVAVVAIAAIGLVFYQLIWPSIRENIRRSTYCSQAYACTDCNEKTCKCTYIKNGGIGDDAEEEEIICPNQNTVTGAN